MVYPETIEAVGVVDWDDYLHPKKFEYKPQAFRDYDIDIKIECCGICGSDIHTVSSDWTRKDVLPLAVGHEIVGTIVKIGPNAKPGLKIGDRVGVGAQCDSDCNHPDPCQACKDKTDNHCEHRIETYFDTNPETGFHTKGGNASHVRLNSYYAFKIPDNLESEYAAPLLCGGLTGFSPLIQNNVGPGSKVGIVGIGGIGHMAILFAKALGAEVTAISRSRSKYDDAKKLGADHYVATGEPEDLKNHRRTLDLIVNTGSSFSKSAVTEILNLLKPRGKFVYITAPPVKEKLDVDLFQLLKNGYAIQGSLIGTIEETEYMLEFAAKHNIKPWVQTIDISEENLGDAWKKVQDGDVHYRYTMVGYDKFFNQSSEKSEKI